MAKVFLRCFVSALGFAVGTVTVFAHSLPNSRLTFTQGLDQIELTLTIPVHELNLALPALTGLGDLPKNTSLPQSQQKDLALYLRQHVTITPANQSALDLQLTSAEVLDAHNKDVGHYDLLEIKMSARQREDQSVFPATLIYDAVLHEVRNHRATVWFAQPGKRPSPVGEIHFDASLGKARPLTLTGIP